jgi:hypothetical protein
MYTYIHICIPTYIYVYLHTYIYVNTRCGRKNETLDNLIRNAAISLKMQNIQNSCIGKKEHNYLVNNAPNFDIQPDV